MGSRVNSIFLLAPMSGPFWLHRCFSLHRLEFEFLPSDCSSSPPKVSDPDPITRHPWSGSVPWQTGAAPFWGVAVDSDKGGAPVSSLFFEAKWREERKGRNHDDGDPKRGEHHVHCVRLHSPNLRHDAPQGHQNGFPCRHQIRSRHCRFLRCPFLFDSSHFLFSMTRNSCAFVLKALFRFVTLRCVDRGDPFLYELCCSV